MNVGSRIISRRPGLRTRVIAGSAFLLVPLLALAAPPMMGGSPMGGGPADGGPEMHGFPGHPGGGGPGFRGHHGGWRVPWELHPRFLFGLKLSEDQQDKVFAIEHAAAPALRDQAKAMRKAHEGLRGLAMSASYDDSQVKSLTDAAAKASAQLMLLRIRGEHDIYKVLTPEQKAELEKRRQRWESHREGHGEGHGGWRGRGGPSPGPAASPSPN
jgi:Spy/CpxP family protein refolding chaperone